MKNQGSIPVRTNLRELSNISTAYILEPIQKTILPLVKPIPRSTTHFEFRKEQDNSSTSQEPTNTTCNSLLQINQTTESVLSPFLIFGNPIQAKPDALVTLLEEANLPPGFPTPHGHRKQAESLERRQTLTPITLPESSPAVIGHVIIDGGDG